MTPVLAPVRSNLATAIGAVNDPKDQSAQFSADILAGRVAATGGSIVTLDYTVEDGFLVIKVPVNQRYADVRKKKVTGDDGKVTQSVTLVCSLRAAAGTDNMLYMSDNGKLVGMPIKPINLNIGLDYKKVEVIDQPETQEES